MATHRHFHPHLPFGNFVLEHPYAGEWLILTIVTLAALLLWVWNA